MLLQKNEQVHCLKSSKKRKKDTLLLIPAYVENPMTMYDVSVYLQKVKRFHGRRNNRTKRDESSHTNVNFVLVPM